MLLLLLLPMLVQGPTERQVLEAEHARAENPAVLVAGTKSTNARVQRFAARAIGRFERPELSDALIPLLRAPNADVRKEAVNALGQLGAQYTYASLAANEKDASVRSVIYETMGRTTGANQYAENEKALSAALADADASARIGAARGIESMVRRNIRTVKPSAATLEALHQAIQRNGNDQLRQLVLYAMNAAADRDSATLAIALRDTSAQVRRMAVLTSRQWVDDKAPMVRTQAIISAGTCGRAIAAVDDSSEMVALAAIDFMGLRKCDASVLNNIVVRGKTWRTKAHALVSLAKSDPDAARKQLPTFVASRNWHERMYAATAARILQSNATLGQLARDPEPNVAIEAMSTSDDAIRALASNHAGLLLAAANQLKGSPDLKKAEPMLFATFERLSKMSRHTVRDPRVAILERLRESIDTVGANKLFDLTEQEIDPVVLALAARIYGEKKHETVAGLRVVIIPAPLVPDATIRALDGATAIVKMKGLGTFTLELLNDEAPIAVSIFAQLSDTKKFNDLTFHRVVPNFVIQGGSPGADEYDGITTSFMRDEVGLARNARGTLGISTRGRDTGDGQIYVNMVDNFRLDHDYTVFARITTGMDVVDRVQEGDVIESIQIVRRKAPSNR